LDSQKKSKALSNSPWTLGSGVLKWGRMKVKCYLCKTPVKVDFLPMVKSEYICEPCQAGYEAGRFRDLVKKRIAKTKDPKK